MLDALEDPDDEEHDELKDWVGGRPTSRPYQPSGLGTMPKQPKRPGRSKHDASYRSFFAQRHTVTDTLRAVAGDVARTLDFSTLERLPASFVTEHLGQRHADMLWRIRTIDET